MNNLQQVFYKFCNKNKEVLICLDDTFCFARSPETKPKNYISITSIMDEEDVYECLKEEGSAIINFKLTNKGVNKNSNINKILNSFVSFLVEFNFDPFIVTLLSTEVIISVVVSDKDIGFVNDLESDNDSSFEDEKDDEDDDEDDEVEKDEDDEAEKDEDDEAEKDDEDDEVEKDDEDDEKDDEDDEKDDEDDEKEDDEKEDDEKDDDEDEAEKAEDDEAEKREDSIDGDTEDVETSDEEEDDEVEDDPIKNEMNIIKSELESENKLKKNDLISYLSRLNIKNINGKNTRHCNKKELYVFLIEKLEN